MQTKNILRAVKNSFSSAYFLKIYCNYFLRHYLFNFSYKDYKFLRGRETLDRLETNRKSFIRLGDGEIAILYGFDVHFQRYSDDLRRALLKILSEYGPASPYLLGVPVDFIERLARDRHSQDKTLRCFRLSEAFLRDRLKKDNVYGDSLLFWDNFQKDWSFFKPLWEGKAVVMIGSMSKYFQNNDLPGASRSFIVEAPEKDAFEKLDLVENNVKELADSKKLEKDKTVILVSLGPAAKPLAYNLSKKGWIVYDTGHFFSKKLN